MVEIKTFQIFTMWNIKNVPKFDNLHHKYYPNLCFIFSRFLEIEKLCYEIRMKNIIVRLVCMSLCGFNGPKPYLIKGNTSFLPRQRLDEQSYFFGAIHLFRFHVHYFRIIMFCVLCIKLISRILWQRIT